jgi:hypothetical protein
MSGWPKPRSKKKKNTRYPSHRRLNGPQGWSGRVRKFSPPPPNVFESQTIQPTEGRYTSKFAYYSPQFIPYSLPNVVLFSESFLRLLGQNIMWPRTFVGGQLPHDSTPNTEMNIMTDIQDGHKRRPTCRLQRSKPKRQISSSLK